MACPKCGHEINPEHFPLGLTFCPYCGDKIGEPEPFHVIPFCSHCGHRLLTTVTFCPECGKRVIPEPAPPAREAACETAPEPAPPLARASAKPYPESRPEPSEAPPAPAVRATALFWPRVKATCVRIYRPVESIVTGRWRLERLYRSWAVHDALPAEEIPSPDSLRQMSPHAASIPARRRPAPWLVLLVCIVAVLFFVAIGILIKISSS